MVEAVSCGVMAPMGNSLLPEPNNYYWYEYCAIL